MKGKQGAVCEFRQSRGAYHYFGIWQGFSQFGHRFLFTGREWLGDLRLYDFLALIRPGAGVGEIRFGSSKADVISALGKPLEEQTHEEGDELLKYPHLGIAFFAFDSSEGMRLTSYELSDQSDAELWGHKIFQCPRKEMSHRIDSAGFILEKAALGDSEDEVLYRVKPLSLDFYYSGQRLEALTAGVIFTDENTIRWPFQED